MSRLLPALKPRFFDSNGDPLAGGKLFVYVANSVTPTTTWSDQAMTQPNSNPIILDANGEANVWILEATLYKFVLKDVDDVVQYTLDEVSVSGTGANGNTILSGSGAPSNGLGVDGDFYYDPATKTMYGPKASGVWPAGVVLSGDDGENGLGFLRAGTTDIPNGATQVVVAFSSDLPDADYQDPTISFSNLTDADPIYLQGMITEKTVSGFTVRLNTTTDSSNYKMGWKVSDEI